MEPLQLAEQYITSTNVSLFLTGRAGTGKTTFLRHIVDTVKKRFVVLAPTGVAAVNASGVTIHSFFQLPLCPFLPDVKELVTEYQMPDKYNKLRREKIKIIRTLELVIIDEISMVRADLLDAVDMTLRRYRRSNKPFGGVQLLMIGDVQQLPPVVKEEEKPFIEQVYPSPFFFNSKALQQIEYVTIELQKVFRQQDKYFIGLLNKIRDNCFDKATLDALNTRFHSNFDPPDNEGYIRLTTHNYQSDEVNHRKLEALDSNPFTLEASVEGRFPDSSYPTEAELVLKKGAQVMFVKNDSQGGQYYNGKIGTVEGYDPNEGVAVVDQDGNHIIVKPERWENIRYEIDPKDNQIKQIVDGVFTQYPLKLAWAITIHKSQGLTFDKVIVDAAAAFTYGQVYVALSRCRSLEGLVLASPISSRRVFDNEEIMRFNEGFSTEQELTSNLAAFQSGYFFEQLYELFDFSEISRTFDRLNTLYQRHFRRMFAEQTQKLSELYHGAFVDLETVSDKFHKQLTRIGMASGGNTDDPLLHERVGKAVEYFQQKLKELYAAVSPLLGVETKNVSVASELMGLREELLDAVGTKMLCMKRVGERGFSTAVYNQAKVDFLLAKDNNSKKKDKKPKKDPKVPKEPKEPTWIESVKLLLEGKSIDEIAKTRHLTPSTIGSHLQHALEVGEIEIEQIVSTEELDEIMEYIVEERPGSLSEMYKHFNGKYTYAKLRAVQYYSKDVFDDF